MQINYPHFTDEEVEALKGEVKASGCSWGLSLSAVEASRWLISTHILVPTGDNVWVKVSPAPCIYGHSIFVALL